MCVVQPPIFHQNVVVNRFQKAAQMLSATGVKSSTKIGCSFDQAPQPATYGGNRDRTPQSSQNSSQIND